MARPSPFAVALRALLFLSPLAQLRAQSANPDCSCPATFDWLATTFAANDAGYPAVVEARGEAAYAKTRDGLAGRAASATTDAECDEVLRDYLAWFRSGHVGIYRQGGGEEQDGDGEVVEPTADELVARFAQAHRCPVDTAALRARLAADPDASPYEGFYESWVYEVAVVRADTAGRERYLGVITGHGSDWWQPGQVKFAAYPNRDAPDGTAGFIRYQDHAAHPLSGVELIGGHLDLQPEALYTRTYPEREVDSAAAIYRADRDAAEPVYRRLSPSTTYLRIPDFDVSQKANIDSVVAVHHGELTATPNLIIDIRGNGGGADASYARLLDLLYTGHMRQVSVELRSTPLKNARNEAFIKDPDMPADVKEWARDMAARLAATDAEWVQMYDERVVSIERDTVYPQPAHVAIITDEANGSTAEQFLLDARQSLKVKTFGARTAGVLDVSNMNHVTSPCGEHQLAYAVSRSFRVPAMPIDDYGVAPDFYLDAGLPRWRWVGYVREVLESESRGG